jgi:transposase
LGVSLTDKQGGLFSIPQRSGSEGPNEFLEGFQGAIQADGWQVYDKFEKRNGITLLGCLAHVRRKFKEAQDNDKSRAAYVLSEIQKLYAIEQKARNEDLDYKARKQLRNDKSKPILQSLKTWLLENTANPTARYCQRAKSAKPSAMHWACGTG